MSEDTTMGTAGIGESIVFRGAFPIGDTDIQTLPVKEIGPAVGYYVHVLGFTLVEKTEKRVTLKRDDAAIGLEVNDKDPEQASCYLEVSDVEALRQELNDRGIDPTPLRFDTHGGGHYKVFFAKEPYGVCFCFGQKLV